MIFFILTSGITCILALIIVPTIHESGHAAACIIQGGAVTHWQPLPFGTEADTACSTGLTPFLCAAGSLASIAAWLLCTYVYSRHATRLHGTPVEFCRDALVLVVLVGVRRAVHGRAPCLLRRAAPSRRRLFRPPDRNQSGGCQHHDSGRDRDIGRTVRPRCQANTRHRRFWRMRRFSHDDRNSEKAGGDDRAAGTVPRVP